MKLPGPSVLSFPGCVCLQCCKNTGQGWRKKGQRCHREFSGGPQVAWGLAMVGWSLSHMSRCVGDLILSAVILGSDKTFNRWTLVEDHWDVEDLFSGRISIVLHGTLVSS